MVRNNFTSPSKTIISGGTIQGRKKEEFVTRFEKTFFEKCFLLQITRGVTE